MAHTSLFEGLKQALGYALTDNITNRLLSHSPTERRRSDVARETTKLTAQLQQLRNTAEHDRKDFQAEKDVLDQRNRKISAEHDDLKTKHQKLATDHTELNTKHSKLTDDHQQLINTNRLRQDKVRTISGRIVPKLGGVATKSLTTLPGRVLPYFGAAASIAFTAWELTELCDLMNDLDELNISFGNAFNDPNKVCGLPRPSISDFHF